MSTGYSLVGANAQDEGSNLGFGSYFNFTGAGVTASISGNVVTVDIPGGGGGTPALPFNSIQYNNAGAFGGSANFTWSGSALVVSNGVGVTDTLSPGSLLFTTTGTAVISVKTAAAIDAPLNLDILDLQVNGASGLAGQVLTSGGPAASPTWAALPAFVTSVTVDAGELTNTGTATAPVLGLATTGVGAGSYTYASLTVDAFGRLTAASSGAAPVTSVSVDAGELTNTGTATAPVLGLATAGTAGTYAYPASVTTDAFGRVTAVTAGTAPLVPAVATTAASPYVVASSTTTVFANPAAAQTIQLPAANAAGVVAGRPYTVKRVNTSANVVTVTSAGGTIDLVAAGTGIALAAGTLDSITVQSDGTNWWIV